jgi:4-oxalocrotonate tautomerase
MSILTEVSEAIQLYFDALYEGDGDKMARVFHPNAHIYSGTGGELIYYQAADYVEAVRTRPSPQSDGTVRRDRIVSIEELDPHMGNAKVETAMGPRRFVDCLSYVKLDGRWQIMSKASQIIEAV